MNIYKIIKVVIIAAGIIVSAVFYTKNNRTGLNADNESFISTEIDLAEETDAKTSTNNNSNIDTGTDTGKDTDSLPAKAKKNDSSSLNGIDRQELSTMIKTAVSEELLEMAKKAPEDDGSGNVLDKAVRTAESEAQSKAALYEGMVNINTATKEELMTLKGIGESRAGAIIEYRETYGDFQYIEEIMNVKGIKEGAFSKIKDSIYI